MCIASREASTAAAWWPLLYIAVTMLNINLNKVFCCLVGIVLIIVTVAYIRIMAIEKTPCVILTSNETFAHSQLVRGPVTAIPRRVWEQYPEHRWRGLQLPVMTAMPSGRLGNNMGEYATLYALGRAYNNTVRLSPQLQRTLNATFPSLTMPLIPGPFNPKEWQQVSRTRSGSNNWAKIEVPAAGLMGPGRFLITGSSLEFQLFHHYKTEILQEFSFTPGVMKEVDTFLKAWMKTWQTEHEESPVLVGIHIRRTDYIKFFRRGYGAVEPGVRYFYRALQYYRDKFSNVRFIAASDNRPYIKEVFRNQSDVILSPGTSAAVDMATMASCNHSITTLGSFGFWCGYLAGGEVVYPEVTVSRALYRFRPEAFSLAGLDNFTPLPAY